MSKIKNCGLDQYGTEPFEQQQFGTAGVEWVNSKLYVEHSFAFHSHTILFSGAKAMPVQRFSACLAATVKVMISVTESNDHSAQYVQLLYVLQPLGSDHEPIVGGESKQHTTQHINNWKPPASTQSANSFVSFSYITTGVTKTLMVGKLLKNRTLKFVTTPCRRQGAH